LSNDGEVEPNSKGELGPVENNLNINAPTRWGLNFLALLGVVVALWFGRPFFLPIVISLLLATALWPAFKFLHARWRIPRVFSGLIVITGLIALSALGILWAVVAVQSLLSDMTQSELDRIYDEIRLSTASIDADLAEELFPVVRTKSIFYPNPEQQWVETEKQKIPQYIQVAIEQTLLILFLILFILIEGDMLIHRTAAIFGSSSDPDFKAARGALSDMARHIRSYIVWRTVINLGMVLVLGLLYKGLGLRQPWTWAILAGILTFVPYIGPVLAGIPAILDAFVYSPGGGMAVFILLIVYAIILILEGYVVFPLVIGRHMEMNATTVMLACVFWWFVWGEIGLFLALPLMAGIKAICYHVPGWRPWANLMGMEVADGPSPGNSGILTGRNSITPAADSAPEAEFVDLRPKDNNNVAPHPVEPTPAAVKEPVRPTQ
jgi:predicted PurR-regulated permease PerM